MMQPDDDFEDEDFHDDDGEEIDLDDREALVWNLLVLINPGDEETALRQFAVYRDAAVEAEEDELVWLVKDAIDWTSGFHVEGHDNESFVDAINELVRRWNIDIDWGGDTSDDDYLDSMEIAGLMALAYDRLREHGYTLWCWNTDGDAQAGWMALSRDDEAMLQLGAALGIELRPGNDPF